jgi:hypothetical protein
MGFLTSMGSRLFSATFIPADGERVLRVYNVLNPEKLDWLARSDS